MTIVDAIQRSADFLAKKGAPSPRLQVELLLAHLLKMPRMNLYLSYSRELTEAEADALRAMVQRRGQREPLQHITGSVSFCGLELIVNRSVLVPRPETELLAERGWKYLAALPGEPPPRALDLGTGSGCVAIALAAHVPAARVTAIELSGMALEVARENTVRNKVADRIQLLHGDLFSPLDSQIQFDLIISNPPYIRSAEIEHLEPEVSQFEPRSALDGGADGADFYRRIAGDGARFLKVGGFVMVELEEEGAEAARRIFAETGWKVESVEHDLNGKPRILVARRGD